MKEAIKEYLNLTKKEKEILWNNAVFVFDTSVLLNLYRYTAKTRNSLLEAMQHFSERIWMPKQVAQELMKNRPKVILDTLKNFDELKKAKDVFIDKCFEVLRREKKDEIITTMSNNIDESLEQLKKTSNYIETVDCDEVLNKLLKLFEHRVGDGFLEAELEKIKKEGEERYTKKAPPGYKDEKKGEENNEYGDLIVWKEILSYSKSNKKDIIFVTGDQKEDWWHKVCGKTLGPRIELKKEFFKETNQKFFMYSMNGFLTQYNDNKPSYKIEEKAINEVKNYENILKERINPISHKRYRILEKQKQENEIRRLKQIFIDLVDEQEELENKIDIIKRELIINQKHDCNAEEKNNLLIDLKRLQSNLYRVMSKETVVRNHMKDLALQKDKLIDYFESEI